VSDGFFRVSPFSLTASRETQACWAGRKSVLSRLVRLKRSFLNRSDSSLDLIWANLGAGKSHALFHLSYLLTDAGTESGKIISVFVEMPDQLRKFQELYARIVAELPIRTVAEHVLDAHNRSVPEDLQRCSRAVIHGGGEDRAIAVEWLLGHRPNLRQLKASTSIQSRIEDDSHACDILSGIVAALAEKGIRLVVLLDEFQRVALLQPQHRRDTVLSNVRSLFSRNPRYFSLVLAVKSRIEQTAIEMMPEELRTIMGVRPGVSLPEMSGDEALEFVIERFNFFRPEGYHGSEDAPFSRETLDTVIKHIASLDGAPLIPRTILQALGWIYDNAEIDSDKISPTEASALLKELRWEALD
jgi:hypothetical protein